jgi:hypothetical protein
MAQNDIGSPEILTPSRELGLGVVGLLGGGALVFAGVNMDIPVETLTGLMGVGFGASFIGDAAGKIYHRRIDTPSTDSTH